MIIRRGRSLTINMGNYESYRLEGSVEVSHEDLALTQFDVSEDPDGTAASLHEFAERTLENILIQDVSEAAELTDERKSFILAALQPSSPKPATHRKR